MKGIEFEEVRNAIVSAFDGDDFDMLLYERLDYDRPQHVGDGPFKRVASEVLRDFERQGLDAILIAEVAAKRPMKKEVQDIYRKYAVAIVDEARQQDVDANRAKAIERYGLIKDVEIQRDGVTVSTLKSGRGGLERAISSLPEIHFHGWLRQMLNWESRVCRVEIDGTPQGTGFLVGEDLVLTNYHVVKPILNAPGGAGFLARFDYWDTAHGPSAGVGVLGAAANWLVAHSPYNTQEGTGNPQHATPAANELDFALVRLAQKIGNMPLAAGVNGSGPRGWVSLPPSPPALGPDMPLLIIQHPRRTPIKLTLDMKSVIEVTPDQRRVRYRTNTDPGSSGSPVLDIHGQLVALHHLGYPEGLEGVPVPDGFNQGIPIITIYEHLKSLGLGPSVTTPSP